MTAASTEYSVNHLSAFQFLADKYDRAEQASIFSNFGRADCTEFFLNFDKNMAWRTDIRVQLLKYQIDLQNFTKTAAVLYIRAREERMSQK